MIQNVGQTFNQKDRAYLTIMGELWALGASHMCLYWSRLGKIDGSNSIVLEILNMSILGTTQLQ